MYKQKTMNWVKPSTVKWYGLVAVLAVLMTSCHQSQEKSNVTTTPTYQDQAEEFKKGLGGENMIMAEIIDSTLQRIYYYDTLKGIINYYDIVARKITPVWNCERVKSAKQYGRRLFYAYNWKDDDYEQVGTTICYIDLTNDSVHYFLSNTQNIDDDINESFIVSFLDDDIVIKTTYESTSWDTHISPYLSDEELNTASQNYTKKHNSVYEHHYEANKPVRNDGGGGGMRSQNTNTTSSYQSTSNSVRQRLEQANQEYFQYINEYNSTSDYMWKMQRLQAAYNANERCIGLARELGNQSVLNGFLQRKAALESMGVR